MSQFIKLLHESFGHACTLSLKEGALVRGVERSLNDNSGVINILKNSEFTIQDKVDQGNGRTLIEICPKNADAITFTDDKGNKLHYESIYVTMTPKEVTQVSFHSVKSEQRYGFPGRETYLPLFINNVEVNTSVPKTS